MNELTVLHLSDLHITTTLSDILQNLLDDIKEQVRDVEPGKLIIVVTGDILHKADINARHAAEAFFLKLHDVLQGKCARIYIVPGNHDAKRTKEKQYLIPSWRFYRRGVAEISVTGGNGTNNKKKGPDIFDKEFHDVFWKYIEKGYRDSGYRDLVKYVYKLFGMDSKNFSFIEDTFGVKYEVIGGVNLVVVLLNTAWSCLDDHDNRQQILGKFQIEEIKRQYTEVNDSLRRKSNKLTIVIGHHPIEAFYGSDQDRLFSELTAYNSLDADFYLCGHTHDRAVTNWSNNRHFLKTFVCGIGWPESNAQLHAGHDHTYAIYQFNMDLNSVDVMVRSTNDDGTFQPDMTIYSNKRDRETKKLVFPIKEHHLQSYFPLTSADNDVPPKCCYFDSELVSAMQEYVHCTGRFIREVEEIVWPKTVETLTLEGVKNEIFLLYIYGITEAIGNNMFDWSDGAGRRSEKAGGVVRIHFRYLDDLNAVNYKKLRQIILRENRAPLNKEDLVLSDCGFIDLLKASFENKHGMLYSVNSYKCIEKPINKEKWDDFYTSALYDEENRVECRSQERKREKEYVPLITFGISIKGTRYRNMLYCLDYYGFDAVIISLIKRYLNNTQMDLKEFCKWFQHYGEDGNDPE